MATPCFVVCILLGADGREIGRAINIEREATEAVGDRIVLSDIGGAEVRILVIMTVVRRRGGGRVVEMIEKVRFNDAVIVLLGVFFTMH